MHNLLHYDMKNYITPVAYGTGATFALLIVYTLVLTLVSGVSFMLDQFVEFWPYVVSLAVGFGIQVSLFSFIHQSVHVQTQGEVLAVSGTTSTVAMVSCCTHYFVNLLPVLGATGLVVFVSQYQVQLFWFGIISNLAGISYMLYKIKTIEHV